MRRILGGDVGQHLDEPAPIFGMTLVTIYLVNLYRLWRGKVQEPVGAH